MIETQRQIERCRSTKGKERFELVWKEMENKVNKGETEGRFFLERQRIPQWAYCFPIFDYCQITMNAFLFY